MKRHSEEDTDLLTRGRREDFWDTKFERLSNCDVRRIITERDSGEFSFEKIPFRVLKESKFFRRSRVVRNPIFSKLASTP